MIQQHKSKALSLFVLLIVLVFTMNCSSDDSSGNDSNSTPLLTILGSLTGFEAVDVLSHSNSQMIQVGGADLNANLNIAASTNFKVSLDDITFSNQVAISKDDANAGNTAVYVRFSPSETAIGLVAGTVVLSSNQANSVTLNVTGIGVSIAPMIQVNATEMNFEDTEISMFSSSMELVVNGNNLESVITLNVSAEFQISLDNMAFTDALEISTDNANEETTIYVRFAPNSVADILGTLTISNSGVESIEINLSGSGLPVVHNYVTFDGERLAFGGGFNQSSTQSYNLHDDVTNIETIKMYVKLRCPSGGCDEWDVYANVKVRDTDSGEMYELGRYITPYWNDNSQLERGFEFDVTDFKSLLTGATELRIRTECWNDRGYEVTVDFDYIEGTPDYQYYNIARVLAYDDWSSSGVPYGVTHNFDLDKSIAIPANAESSHLRTVISGWGHATPNDTDGRPCAEWCYRTHDVKINGATAFQHNLAPLGCASNPVSNQNPGNWQPDRAGWCPGMVVPYRIDELDGSNAGSTIGFEYDYEDWVTDGLNGNAFYATSTFVVVKSSTPIAKPGITE